MKDVIYPIFYSEDVKEDELSNIKKNGKKVISTSEEIEVTTYHYNGKIYVTDVKEIGEINDI
jgi:hypothetical protein